MTTDTRPPDAGEAMVGALHARRGDRALLAQLRRAAGRPFGDDPEAARALFSTLPRDVSYGDRTLENLHLVATIFAVHPADPGHRMPKRGSLGGTLNWVSERAQAAAERQLHSLLVADREDLPWHLRRAATLARSHDVAIDYHRLWRDVRGWSSDERWVQRRWAADFYNAPPTQEPNA